MTRYLLDSRLPPTSAPALALVLVLHFLLLAGCREGTGSAVGSTKQAVNRAKPPATVTTAKAEVVTLSDRLELTGSVEPTRIARMVSPVEGPIVACSAREGDRVRAGQLLARLGGTKGDDATVVYARAELEKDELELSRIEKLVESGAVPGEALDRARVDVSEAQARLARASEKLGDYRIVAPWSGIVSKVHVTVGDFVSERVALIELFDPKSLVLRFAVPEKKAALVRDAAAITLMLDAYPGQLLSATVTRVYPEIDRRTHTRTVEGEIDCDAALVPGMFVRLDLTLSSVPVALAVPVEAVIHQESTEPVVFVITDDGVAHRRPVKTGIEDGDLVQILAGVDPGEQVAVAGHGQLRDGAKVRAADGHGGTAKSTRGRGVQPPEAAASDTSP